MLLLVSYKFSCSISLDTQHDINVICCSSAADAWILQAKGTLASISGRTFYINVSTLPVLDVVFTEKIIPVFTSCCSTRVFICKTYTCNLYVCCISWYGCAWDICKGLHTAAVVNCAAIKHRYFSLCSFYVFLLQLRQFRDHRWKALNEENPDLSGLFLCDHFLTSYFLKQVKTGS